MAYWDRKTASDKKLGDKVFNIARNVKHDGYQRVLASVVFNFFSVTHKRRGINFKNQRLANELHKLGLKKTKYIDPAKTKLGV